MISRPVEIGLRSIDRHRVDGASLAGRASEAAGIAKEIEKALPARLRLHQRARLAMVGEEPGVDEVVEVDEELQFALADLYPVALRCQPFVLLSGAAPIRESHGSASVCVRAYSATTT